MEKVLDLYGIKIERGPKYFCLVSPSRVYLHIDELEELCRCLQGLIRGKETKKK